MSYRHGYQSLWREVAKRLDVRVGTPVTSITRPGTGTGRAIEIEAAGKTEFFDRVVVAAPLETADKFMDLSATERELFGKIRTVRYIVTVASADAKVHVAFAQNISPDRLGHVNAALKFYEDSDVCVYFQMVDRDTTKAEALAVLRADLEEVGIRLKDVHLQKAWNYFPHVGSEDLDDGFYDKLEAMQGERGTYYAGSALSFESVEHTAAYSVELINRYF